MKRSDVLIIGAGPTGLVLALWLSKLGVKVRVLDKTAAAGATSRALAVQARTLELYRQLDLSNAVVQGGHKVPAVNLWVKGEQTARLPFEDIGKGLTPYSFLEIFPQDQHEQLLIKRLEQFGVAVERQTELTHFVDNGDRVTARLLRANGQEELCETNYLAGCDGARSIVRKTLNTGFPGGTYQQVFYVADVEAAGPAINGELHVDLDEADFLAVFPLAGEGRARLIGTVRDERAEHAERIEFAPQLVATTDRVFTFATAEGRIANLVRTRIAPLLFPKVVSFEPVREYLFRTVSQITLNYRGMHLSAGSAGHVHGGDRLPWAPDGETDNFDSLSKLSWQIHVYGVASDRLIEWCAHHGMPLYVFEWHATHKAAGLARDAFYLLRPDTYVALAEVSGDPMILDSYFAERKIRF